MQEEPAKPSPVDIHPQRRQARVMKLAVDEDSEDETILGSTPSARTLLERQIWPPSTATRAKPRVVASTSIPSKLKSTVYDSDTILSYTQNGRLLRKVNPHGTTGRVSPNDYIDLGPDHSCVVKIYEDDSRVSPPPKYSEKILLLLDMNGVLMDREYHPLPRGAVETAEQREGGYRMGPYLAWKRPNTDEFLDYCFKRFEVAVWTTMTLKNAEPLTKFVFGNRVDQIRGILHQEHCEVIQPLKSDNPEGSSEDKGKSKKKDYETEKPIFRKNLRIIWETNSEFDQNNTIILDDSDEKMVNNPRHCFFNPGTWKRTDNTDDALAEGGDVRTFLESVLLTASFGDLYH